MTQKRGILYTTRMITLKQLVHDEALRRREFPVAAERVYMAHAGVTALPRRAADAICAFARAGSGDNQETQWGLEQIEEARASMGRLIGAEADEVALLGPTAVGLNLVANGLDWEAGDEVVFYPDDYPSNVYPWKFLETAGVTPIPLVTEHPGVILWEHVEAALSARTKLVALASCNFLSGFRIDIDGIGRALHDRGILFSVDGIQTVGAFATPLEYVDFMSADSHKWMLGPAAAGVFYVKRARQALLRPSLIGAFNVVSPQFVAQETIRYYAGARRYEAGILNFPGIAGMVASAELLMEIGADAIAARLLDLRRGLLDRIRPLGFRLYLEDFDGSGAANDSQRSAIVTVRHPSAEMAKVFTALKEGHISASLRQNRAGESFVRFSPHFYNTEEELDRVAAVLRQAVG